MKKRYCEFSGTYSTKGYHAYDQKYLTFYDRICFVNWEKLPNDGPGTFNKINHIIFDEQIIADSVAYNVHFKERVYDRT